MKKCLFLLLLLMIPLISGCEKVQPLECESGYHVEGEECVPDEIIDEGCLETELEVGDECIALTGAQWQLYHALEESMGLENLTMSVTIIEGETTTDTLWKLDGLMSLYEDANETVTVVQGDGGCTVYVEAFDAIDATDVMCPAQPLLFYRSFTYDMFTLESGAYHLNASGHAVLSAFLDEFDSAQVDDFILRIADNQITQMELFLTADEVPIHMLFEIIDVDQTVIDVPSEG